MKSSLASLALVSIAPEAEVSPRRLNNAEATAKHVQKENIAQQYNETNSSQKKRKKRKESELHKKRKWCLFYRDEGSSLPLFVQRTMYRAAAFRNRERLIAGLKRNRQSAVIALRFDRGKNNNTTIELFNNATLGNKINLIRIAYKYVIVQ